MSVRMNGAEKYRHLRDQMDEAVREVAAWPQWMHDRVERERLWSRERHQLEQRLVSETSPKEVL